MCRLTSPDPKLKNMNPEIQKSKVEKYGSFLHCPDRNRLCFCCNTEDGTCGRASCILDDPEYIALQERIEKNRIRNQTEKDQEVEETPPPQKSRAQIIRGEIAKLENYARKYYRTNRPKKGDEVIGQIMMLQRELNALERKK